MGQDYTAEELAERLGDLMRYDLFARYGDMLPEQLRTREEQRHTQKTATYNSEEQAEFRQRLSDLKRYQLTVRYGDYLAGTKFEHVVEDHEKDAMVNDWAIVHYRLLRAANTRGDHDSDLFQQAVQTETNARRAATDLGWDLPNARAFINQYIEGRAEQWLEDLVLNRNFSELGRIYQEDIIMLTKVFEDQDTIQQQYEQAITEQQKRWVRRSGTGWEAVTPIWYAMQFGVNKFSTLEHIARLHSLHINRKIADTDHEIDTSHLHERASRRQSDSILDNQSLRKMRAEQLFLSYEAHRGT